ncbi:unnamed protein product [Discosporangium mesarthrocarpum]
MSSSRHYNRIGIQGHSLGSLTLTPNETIWTSADKSTSKHVKWGAVSTASWSQFGEYCHLRLFMKEDAPPVRLDGFNGSLYTEIESFLAKLGIELKKENVNCGGGNYGNFELLDNTIRFTADNKTVFDLNIKDVSQCVMPGINKKSNDVSLQFHESDAADQMEDSLVAIRVTLPETYDDDEEEASPAEILQREVMERANIHDVKGKVLVEFDQSQGTFDTPRGRYSIEMYSHFMRMHSSRYDYKIQYNDISKLFLLEKPDERFVAFVISLDKPIHQGQQRYQHLVLRTTKDEAAIVVNMTEEDLKEKYDGNLNSEMTGPLHNLIAKVFKVLSGKSVYVTGKFSSVSGAKAVKCTLGTNDGLLYPLNKSFIFIHKPTCIISFDEIEAVEFQRYGGAQGAGVTRNFDLCVTMKSVAGEAGKPYTFSGIERPEYDSLYEFLRTKKLRIKNIKQESDNSLLRLGDLDDHDPYKAAMEDDEGEGEESEEDADYAPPSDSDAGEPSGSGSDSDSDGSEESDHGRSKVEKTPRDKSKEPKPKVKATPQQKRPSGNESRSPTGTKKRRKKDPNAPKRALSAFMQFSQAKRSEVREIHPGLKFTEISKLLGERWTAMGAEEKKPYDELARIDKERYKREMEEYKPPVPEESDKRNEDDHSD